jgi:hypothetical protein
MTIQTNHRTDTFTPTTGGLNVVGTLNSGNTFSFENRIINGAMTFDQRNAGASVSIPTSDNYVIDRWWFGTNQSGKLTGQQNAGGVTPPVGFTNYLGFTSTSSYTLGANDYFVLTQLVEGYNVSDMEFGTANASTFTISFWVYSSLTGTFTGNVANKAATGRYYAFSYTINSANTWEYKTITIPGDTTGTWVKTTNIGLVVNLALGVGSNWVQPGNAWTLNPTYGVSGSTSIVGTSGATFYVTGVQVEKGSAATNFDFRAPAIEFSLCQRYYITQSIVPGMWYSTTASSAFFSFPVEMRAAPTSTYVSTLNMFNPVYGNVAITGIAASTFTTYGGRLVLNTNTATNVTAGMASFTIQVYLGAFNFSAELTT